MAKKTVTITIDDRDGTFEVDTAGFMGKSCDEVHKAFEGIGSKKFAKKKPEYTRNSTITTISTCH